MIATLNEANYHHHSQFAIKTYSFYIFYYFLYYLTLFSSSVLSPPSFLSLPSWPEAFSCPSLSQVLLKISSKEGVFSGHCLAGHRCSRVMLLVFAKHLETTCIVIYMNKIKWNQILLIDACYSA